MFQRQAGSQPEEEEEEVTADRSSKPFWPPGFRDRLKDCTSPRSRDPFGKSSDQVIQQLRDELDKHRQMFFDRVTPHWDSPSPPQSMRVSHYNNYYSLSLLFHLIVMNKSLSLLLRWFHFHLVSALIHLPFD